MGGAFSVKSAKNFVPILLCIPIKKSKLDKECDCMKKRSVISILLYLFGIVLFVVSNFSVVSGSPIHLEYFQRVVLCGAAVCSIGIAPFIYKSKTKVETVIKFVIAVALICSVFAFGGFANNSMA